MQRILRRAAQFANGSKKQTYGTPASDIASAIRVSAIFRDGQVIENRRGWTRRSDAQPLAGSANLARRSSTFVDSLAPRLMCESVRLNRNDSDVGQQQLS